jgi:hypothetical protein
MQGEEPDREGTVFSLKTTGSECESTGFGASVLRPVVRVARCFSEPWSPRVSSGTQNSFLPRVL